MHLRVTLTDNTHFRMSTTADRRGRRVSFDQADREQVWGFYPVPERWSGSDAELAAHIARDSAEPGQCSDIARIDDVR